jgi:ParB family chromosome partitioning protein
MSQIEQLPEGEKLPKQVMESVLTEEGVRRSKKKETVAPATVQASASPASSNADLPPWETAPDEIAPPAVVRRRVNPNKVKMVADILGLSDGDEDEVLARLIDEFLALKAEGNTPL